MIPKVHTDNIIATGIDTLSIEINSKYNAQEIFDLLKPLGVTKSYFKKDGKNIIISILVSKHLNGKFLVDSIKVIKSLVEQILEKVKATLVKIIRVDIALDLDLNLEGYKE